MPFHSLYSERNAVLNIFYYYIITNLSVWGLIMQFKKSDCELWELTTGVILGLVLKCFWMDLQRQRPGTNPTAAGLEIKSNLKTPVTVGEWEQSVH